MIQKEKRSENFNSMDRDKTEVMYSAAEDDIPNSLPNYGALFPSLTEYKIFKKIERSIK